MRLDEHRAPVVQLEPVGDGDVAATKTRRSNDVWRLARKCEQLGDDLSELGLGGFLAGALEEIREEAAAAQEAPPAPAPFQPGLPDDEASARDALFLLYRLTQGDVR